MQCHGTSQRAALPKPDVATASIPIVIVQHQDDSRGNRFHGVSRRQKRSQIVLMRTHADTDDSVLDNPQQKWC